jgi:nesprin-1
VEYIIHLHYLVFLIQDLIASKDDGDAKVKKCESQAEKTITHSGAIGRQAIQRELETLKHLWTTYCDELDETKTRLNEVLQKWQTYEETYDRLLDWVKDTEKKVKDTTLVARLEDKKAQVKKYQV